MRMYQNKLSGCQHLVNELLYLHITVSGNITPYVNTRSKRYFLFNEDDVTTFQLKLHQPVKVTCEWQCYSALDTWTPHLVESEEVEELVCAHAVQARVLLADDGVGDAHLEFLQSHDLLLQCSSGDQPVHVHNPFLHKVKHKRSVLTQCITRVRVFFPDKWIWIHLNQIRFFKQQQRHTTHCCLEAVVNNATHHLLNYILCGCVDSDTTTTVPVLSYGRDPWPAGPSWDSSHVPQTPQCLHPSGSVPDHQHGWSAAVHQWMGHC